MGRLIVAIFLSILVAISLILFSPHVLFASQTSLNSGCVSLVADPSVGGAPLAVNFSGEGFDQGRSIGIYEFDFGDVSGVSKE